MVATPLDIQTDLDKGGGLPQNVKTNLGPTTGIKITNSPVDIEWQLEGGGGLLLTGARPPIIVPDWLTINSWYILAPIAGSVVIDIWKVSGSTYLNGTVPTVANTITGTDVPTLSSATSAYSLALTGWTKQINQNDVLVINLSSVTNLTSVSLILRCIRNIGPS